MRNEGCVGWVTLSNGPAMRDMRNAWVWGGWLSAMMSLPCGMRACRADGFQQWAYRAQCEVLT